MRFPMPRMPRKWRERLHRWNEAAAYHLGRPYRFVAGMFTSVGSFFSKAWGIRNLRYMLQGLPAVAAVIAVGVLAVNLHGADQGALAKKYWKEAYLAQRSENYELARSCIEKAIKLEPGNDDMMFFLAQILDQSKVKNPAAADHALAVMRKLAPDTKPGYAPAHIWVGDYMFSTAKDLGAAQNHYMRAYQAGKAPAASESVKATLPDSAQRLSAIYFFLQNFPEALEYANTAVASLEPRKANLLKLQVISEIHRRNNKIEESHRVLEDCARYFERELKANVDDREAYMWLAVAQAGLDRYSEAVETLTKGAVATKELRFQSAAAEAFALWEIHLTRNKKGTPLAERLALIQEGLRIAPNNQRLIARLIELSRLKGEDGEKAQTIMQDMLAKGQSAFIIHNLLAMRCYSENREKEARYHWEQAFKLGEATLDPNALVVANNLAWLMAHEPNADLSKPLEMMNRVLEKAAGVGKFHGTRGWILYKMGRLAEARPDLDKALAASKDDPDIFDALAAVYEEQGIKNMAETYRRTAAELREKAPKPGALPVPSSTPEPKKADIAPPPEDKPKTKVG